MDKAAELNRKMMNWITGNDVGLSAQTLWAVIMGLEMHIPSVPRDVYDFVRCYNLLKLCDEETRHKTIHDVAERYHIWKSFDTNWNNLTELYESGNAQELNRLIQTCVTHPVPEVRGITQAWAHEII